MTNYITTETALTIQAAENAGIIKPGNIAEQVDEIVAQWRLIIEASEAGEQSERVQVHNEHYRNLKATQ